jgi:plastocyanin
MPSWAIEIVESKGVTSFDPKVLPAILDDLVCWNNNTKQPHQPWQTDANWVPIPADPGTPSYMSDPIPGKTDQGTSSSQPGYDVQAGPTLYYYCALHPKNESERGTITVSTS